MNTLNGMGSEAAHRRASARGIQLRNLQATLARAKVYVDPVLVYPTKIPCFKAGSCHLFMDPTDDLAPLHEVARCLGLKRAWFQGDKKIPHYDLTVSKRSAAVSAGVTEVDHGFLRESGERWDLFRVGVKVVEKLTGDNLTDGLLNG